MCASYLRRSLELLYQDSCSIYNEVAVFNQATKQTSFTRSVVAAGVPCRISFGTIAPAGQGNEVTTLTQTVKLFLSPSVAVLPGSRIVVTRGGAAVEYKASGQPARYPSHQEVMLELVDGRA